MKKIILILIAFIFLLACKKEETTDLETPSTGEIVLYENVQVLTTDQMSMLISVSPDKLKFSQNPGIKEGDIVIGQTSSTNPEGFLRKIESINGQDYSVSYATLKDVIKEGKINFSTNELNPTKSILQKGVTQTISEKGLEYTFNKAIYGNGQITGKIMLSNSIIGEIGVKGGFHVNLEDNFVVHSDFKFVAKEGANIFKEVVLINFNLGTITIPTVPPVSITPQFSLTAKLQGSVVGEINAMILNDFTVNSELIYESGSWSKEINLNNSFGVNNPTISLNAETHLGLEASLGFLFYGMAGPAFEVEPYTEFEVSLTANPWWKLYGGLIGKIKIKTANWLGKNIQEPAWPIFDSKELIKSANGGMTNDPPNANFTASSTNVAVGEIIQFTDLSSENPTSWHWDFGDGEVLLIQNPTHSYSSPGDYTITLGVSNEYGEDFETKLNYIHVESGGGGNTFTDTRDGQIYNIVTIGSQTWFAENLDYDNGNGVYHEEDLFQEYGRYYERPSAFSACPSGWHLPSKEEWEEMINYLGGQYVAGGKLKEEGTTHWLPPNTGATNEVNFSALPGGFYNINLSMFYPIGDLAVFWTSSSSATGPLACEIENDNTEIHLYSEETHDKIPIRPIKD